MRSKLFAQLESGSPNDYNEQELEKPSPELATEAEAARLPSENSSRTPYSYQALDSSRSEIRISGLRDGRNRHALIEGDLIHFSLDGEKSSQIRDPKERLAARARRQSRAVSYALGPQKDTTSIIFGGQELCVTKSLESALRQMRPNAKSSTSAPYLGDVVSSIQNILVGGSCRWALVAANSNWTRCSTPA